MRRERSGCLERRLKRFRECSIGGLDTPPFCQGKHWGGRRGRRRGDHCGGQVSEEKDGEKPVDGLVDHC